MDRERENLFADLEDRVRRRGVRVEERVALLRLLCSADAAQRLGERLEQRQQAVETAHRRLLEGRR